VFCVNSDRFGLCVDSVHLGYGLIVIDLDFALNGKGSAMEQVLSSRSLRYARAVFTMEGKGSTQCLRERRDAVSNEFFFSANESKAFFQKNLFSTNERNSAYSFRK
jgi:hypothetical protein